MIEPEIPPQQQQQQPGGVFTLGQHKSAAPHSLAHLANLPDNRLPRRATPYVTAPSSTLHAADLQDVTLDAKRSDSEPIEVIASPQMTRRTPRSADIASPSQSKTRVTLPPPPPPLLPLPPRPVTLSGRSLKRRCTDTWCVLAWCGLFALWVFVMGLFLIGALYGHISLFGFEFGHVPNDSVPSSATVAAVPAATTLAHSAVAATPSALTEYSASELGEFSGVMRRNAEAMRTLLYKAPSMPCVTASEAQPDSNYNHLMFQTAREQLLNIVILEDLHRDGDQVMMEIRPADDPKKQTVCRYHRHLRVKYVDASFMHEVHETVLQGDRAACADYLIHHNAALRCKVEWKRKDEV